MDLGSVVTGVAGGGGLATVVTMLLGRTRTSAEAGKFRAEAAKTTADAAQVLANTLSAVLDPMTLTLKRVQADHESCEKRADTLANEIAYERRKSEQHAERIADLEEALRLRG